MALAYTVRCTKDEVFVKRNDGAAGDDWFAFHSNSDGKLVFSRRASGPSTGDIRRTLEAAAIYGAFPLLSGHWLGVVTRTSVVAPGPDGCVIHRAEEFAWLQVPYKYSGSSEDSASSGGGGRRVTSASAAVASSERGRLTPAEEKDEQLYLSLLSRIAHTRSFYFAVNGSGGAGAEAGYDLTSSLQANDALTSGAADSRAAAGAGAPVGTQVPVNVKGGGSSKRQRPSWATADARFWWNASASAAMTAAAAQDGGAGAFITLFINGFVTSAEVRQPEFEASAKTHSGSSGGFSVTPGPNGSVTLLLISRRGWARQGTRFHVRGADPAAADGGGAVANYAETEQLLLSPVDASACSHVQVRGSIPLPWDQRPTLKYTPKAGLTAGRPDCLSAAQRHFAAQLASYGRVTAINLIDKKGDQRLLGQAYEAAVAALFGAEEALMVTAQQQGQGQKGADGAVAHAQRAAAAAGVASAAAGAASALAAGLSGVAASSSSSSAASSAGESSPAAAGASAAGTNGTPSSVVRSPATAAGSKKTLPRVGYVWFDFHHECRKMKWGNLSKLVGATSDVTEAYGWYGRDARGLVARVQSGVLRTNCMDNLDRTNVVQSLFARRAALEALPGAWAATSASGCSVLTSPFPSFERAFNHAWADNADALSLLYSGTGALKTDFTRTGKRTLAGALSDGVNSLTRYVLNNLEDGRTQDAWDLFTGAFQPSRAGPHGGGAAKGKAALAGSAATLTAAQAHASGITAATFLSSAAAVFVSLSLVFAYLKGALIDGHLLADGAGGSSGSSSSVGHGPGTGGLLTALLFQAGSPSVTAARLGWGALAAAAVMGAAAYVLVGKGHPLGKKLVSRPTFLRRPSVSFHSAASLSASVSSPTNGSSAMEEGGGGGGEGAALLGEESQQQMRQRLEKKSS